MNDGVTNRADYDDQNEWRVICETTLSNLSNMQRRFKTRRYFSDFFLVYYSVFMIINTITIFYFEKGYNGFLGGYFNLILSICLLAFSLISSNAHYPERLQKVEKAIHEVKTIKREFGSSSCCLETQKARYYQAIDGVEIRSDIDFFRTIKQQCVANDAKWNKLESVKKIVDTTYRRKILKYLSEINPHFTWLKILIYILCYVSLILLPIALVLSCIFI